MTPREARCISCGCTDTNGCVVRLGDSYARCFWVLVDRRRREGLCVACATPSQAIYAVLAQAGDVKPAWAAADLAAFLHVTHYTVTFKLQQLSRKKLIKRDGKGWRVTP